MASREQKIENLLKLIKGEINPDDLKPKRLCMAIGYEDEPLYTVNEERVTEGEFWKYAKPGSVGQGVFEECVVTYGETL